MLSNLEINASKFGRIYKDERNREQTQYCLPKRETLILISGYSIKLRARIIDRWQELENKSSIKPTSLTEYDKSIIGNMVKNCTGLVIRQELENLIPALIEPMVKAGLLERNILVRHGKTAGEIWRAHRLPRLKNAAVWLGNRLQEMGCAIESNGRAERGAYTVRLFDPDKAEVCFRNGLLHTAKIYADERIGQGKLRLVTPISTGEKS